MPATTGFQHSLDGFSDYRVQDLPPLPSRHHSLAPNEPIQPQLVPYHAAPMPPPLPNVSLTHDMNAPLPHWTGHSLPNLDVARSAVFNYNISQDDVHAPGPLEIGLTEHSNVENSESSTADGSHSPSPAMHDPAARPEVATPFISKLYSLLNSPEHRGVIHWTLDGRGFIFAHTKQELLDAFAQFFRHSNVHSFVRQLNICESACKRSGIRTAF